MKKLILLVSAFVFIALPVITFAQTPLESFTENSGLGPVGFKAPQQVAAEIIAVALEFVGIIALAMLLWAGFQYMTSQGNPDKVGQAVKTIRNVVIGIVIIMSAYSIAAWTIYTYACRGINQTNVRVNTPLSDRTEGYEFGITAPSFNLDWRGVSQECLGQLRFQLDAGF